MPVDEARRLAALHRLEILDTAPEARFDRLTELAALVIGTPIALVSLVDRDRQWFKSKVGLDADETARDLAFCAHAIVATGEGPFEVEDATLDPRFADNPLVTGDPKIRFYAGQVIRGLDGEALGTLCTIDRRPRRLDDTQRQALRHIAALVERELHRKDDEQLLVELNASERTKTLILDTLTEGVVLQGRDGAIKEWNPAAQRVLGLTGDELCGRTSTDSRWMATYRDGTAWTGDSHPAMEVLRTGRAVTGMIMGVERSDGVRRWLRVNSEPVLDEAGDVTHALTAFADVTLEIDEAARRLEVEQALQASERVARLSLDALEQGVILADRTGTIHRLNPAAQRILGYTAVELSELWRSPDWITYDEDGALLPREQRPLVRVATTGQPVVGQVVGWRRRDGQRIMIRLSCIPNADGDGGLLIAFTDITTDHLAQRLLDATLETAPVGLAILDTDRSILRCNPEFASQAGRSVDDLVGADVITLLHHDERTNAKVVGQHIRNGTNARGELEQRVHRPDGTDIWVKTHLAVIPNAGRPLAIAATFDITEQRNLLLELSRFELLFQHANDIIVVIDRHGQVKYASPSNERILGYPDGHHDPAGVLGLVHPDDLAKTVIELEGVMADTRPPTPFTVRIRTFDGSWRHMECVAVNLLEQAEVAGVVITARDTTEREQLTAQLAHRALHDPLTDLPNRQLFEQQLVQALARQTRSNEQLAVCYIDLDDFKAINDHHGHAVGDAVLVQVADVMRSSIRAGDTAARLGGDEFVIILDPITSSVEALDVCHRVRNGILQLNDGAGINPGASIGIALSEPFDSVASLVKRADDALYRAKAQHNSSIATG